MSPRVLPLGSFSGHKHVNIAGVIPQLLVAMAMQLTNVLLNFVLINTHIHTLAMAANGIQIAHT